MRQKTCAPAGGRQQPETCCCPLLIRRSRAASLWSPGPLTSSLKARVSRRYVDRRSRRFWALLCWRRPRCPVGGGGRVSAQGNPSVSRGGVSRRALRGPGQRPARGARGRRGRDRGGNLPQQVLPLSGPGWPSCAWPNLSSRRGGAVPRAGAPGEPQEAANAAGLARPWHGGRLPLAGVAAAPHGAGAAAGGTRRRALDPCRPCRRAAP